MSLIDPVIEDPQVNKDGSLKEAPAPQDKPDKTELQVWAESKGFDPNLDPKFLESYRNLEQDRGRLANEVGESRALMDRVIQLEENRQSQTVVQEEEFTLDPTDLLANPREALDTYFEKRVSAELKARDDRIANLEGQLGQVGLNTRHDNVEDVVNSPEFIEFVKASPSRMIAGNAAVAGDVQALDALLTEFSGQSNSAPANEEPVADPGAAALEAARQASLESSAPSGNTSSDKVYSRTALIKMKIEDPEGYLDPTFQEEVTQAYLDGRVK